MDTQDHALYHVWIHFIPTSLYSRREKTFDLSWYRTQVLLLHKQPLWPLGHSSSGFNRGDEENPCKVICQVFLHSISNFKSSVGHYWRSADDSSDVEWKSISLCSLRTFTFWRADFYCCDKILIANLGELRPRCYERLTSFRIRLFFKVTCSYLVWNSICSGSQQKPSLCI